MPSTTSSTELPPNTIRVKLVKQRHGGLGFLVKQRALKPFVLVASIVKGGVAEESGLVQIGDIILRINDIDLTDMSYTSAIEVLKAVPIDTPVVLLLKGPEGYTTYLQTSFLENGVPRTVRVTKPLHDSIMGRLKKTFSGSSGQISPVKGLKRLCNGELDGKNKKGDDDGTDKDADSTGGGGEDAGSNKVSMEECGDPETSDANHEDEAADASDNNTTPNISNGEAVRGTLVHSSANASKFLFKNEGRMESEEETVLDNGTVGSPKIVLTSPKSKDETRANSLPRAQTFDSGVGESCRSPCQKKSIEIVQNDDEITVVVKGDLCVRTEDLSSTDPNTPKRFIISSSKHSQKQITNNNNNNNTIYGKEITDNNQPNNTVNTGSSPGTISRSGSKKRSGRSSPKSPGRVSPTGTRNSRSPVTSPTKHAKPGYTSDDENGFTRSSSDKRR
ncbi:unnamed protein product [Candidula unifasciata]|uniref:PDZ domain-containing protein n=1 Tax=Candidula unifasciata TaxID=100452 RepID=A0A8S3ZKG6_9EUPU|nr:unnamed protein product [Candidula unifasciata]